MAPDSAVQSPSRHGYVRFRHVFYHVTILCSGTEYLRFMPPDAILLLDFETEASKTGCSDPLGLGTRYQGTKTVVDTFSKLTSGALQRRCCQGSTTVSSTRQAREEQIDYARGHQHLVMHESVVP